MRIISGKWARRRLAKVRGDIRPTGVRLRTSLFDSYGDRIKGSHWLDGFAGSGAVGLEALSRGAASVVFNERDEDALKILRRNLEICGLPTGHQVLDRDIFALLRTFRPERRFDVIFLDPPYDFGRYEKLLTRVASSGWLAADGRIVLEAFKRTEPQPPQGLTLLRRMRASDDVLNIYGPTS